MSEEQSAPSAEAPESVQEATTAPAPTQKERVDALVDRMVGRKVQRVEEPAERPEAAEEPAEAASEPTGDVEESAEVEDVSVEPETPAEKRENARLAKVLVDLEREQAARLRESKRSKEFEAKLKALEGDPEAALKLAGTDVDTFLKKIINREIKKPEEDKLTPEQKLARDLEARVKHFEEKEAKAAEKEVFDKEIAIIESKLAESDLDSFPGAAQQVYNLYYSKLAEDGDPPDLGECVTTIVGAYERDLHSILSSEKSARMALRDPKTREVVLKLLREELGTAEKEKPARQDKTRATPGGNGPSVITPRIAAQVIERKASEKLSPEERKARGVAILLNKLER